MASIIKRKSGAYTVKVYFRHSYQDTIRLSTKNRREAERIAEKIQDIVNSKKSGTSTPESEAWLAKLRDADSKLYTKLVGLGLAEKVEKKETHTILDVAASYFNQRRLAESSIYHYNRIAKFLFAYFGPIDVSAVTEEMATQAATKYRVEPLNTRSKDKPPKRYAEAHVNRAIVIMKTFFIHAERIGWIEKSPFRFITGGKCVNPKSWRYVSIADFMKILSCVRDEKYRLIFALGRFAGLRGVSEMHSLRWDMVNTEKGFFTVHSDKLEIHGKAERTIPIPPVLAECFKQYHSVSPDSDLVFPGMHKMDLCKILVRYTVMAGLEPWPRPWYNLRRSYCSDVMESGLDAKQYEEICGHSFTMGMQHYQILHPDRQKRGFEKVLSALSTGSDFENVP